MQNSNIQSLGMMSVKDLSKILGMTRHSLSQQISINPQNYPPRYKIGSAKNSPILFKKQEVESWLESKRI